MDKEEYGVRTGSAVSVDICGRGRTVEVSDAETKSESPRISPRVSTQVGGADGTRTRGLRRDRPRDGAKSV